MIPIRPAAHLLAQPYWAELAQGRLSLQHCSDCGAFRHPPGPICAHCRSFRSGWAPASGRATLNTYTEVFHAVHPALQAEVPYVVTLVDLEEGVRMVSGIRSVPAASLRVGMPLLCRVVRIDSELCLPFFEPA